MSVSLSVPLSRWFTHTKSSQSSSCIEHLFQIAFASGEWVKVTDFRSYLNVEVQVTGSEFGVTSGLCGTFDNNTRNDLTAPDGRVFPYSTVPQQFTETLSLIHI